MEIRERINEIYEDVVAIRRDLHRHPELSEQEVRTQSRVVETLRAWGIECREMATNYGVVGLIRGKAGGIGCGAAPGTGKANTVGTGKAVTVAIRGDMDALPISETAEVEFRSDNPGVMHACGHDLHTAILLGTARILKDMEGELRGNVKLLFQPAEETVGGALPMIREGCLRDPDVSAVIGLHVAPGIPAGAVELRRGKHSAASNEFQVVLRGRSCHGAHPEQGRDALLAGCYLVAALQSVVSRNLGTDNPAVVTAGQFHAGTKSNIVAGEAVIDGIMRTLDPETRSFVKGRIQEVCRHVAASMDVEAEVRFRDSYPALINDDWVEDVLERVARENLPPELVYRMESPTMGTEDFAYFCQETRGAYFNLGTRAPGDESIQALHSDRFCPDESCIRNGILMEVKTALALLEELERGCDGESGKGRCEE